MREALRLPHLGQDGAVVRDSVQHVLVPRDGRVPHLIHGTEALGQALVQAQLLQLGHEDAGNLLARLVQRVRLARQVHALPIFVTSPENVPLGAVAKVGSS